MSLSHPLLKSKGLTRKAPMYPSLPCIRDVKRSLSLGLWENPLTAILLRFHSSTQPRRETMGRTLSLCFLHLGKLMLTQRGLRQLLATASR